MNIADAVLTGIVGWLIAKAFKPSAPFDEPKAPPMAPTTPHPGAPPSPSTVPWPRGDTSVPAPVPGPLSTPEDARKAMVREPGAQRPYPGIQPPHILLPSGEKYFFKRSGAAPSQTEEAAVIARERLPFDRSYWRPKRKLGGAIVTRAKQLLASWRQGGVFFEGPRTFAGRVQFRMVKHSGKKAVEAWEPAPPFV